MIYILLSIICSTSLFVIFKYLDKYKIDSFLIIVLNYFVAATLGFLLNINYDFSNIFLEISKWYYLAAIIGVLFILMFFVIDVSSQKIGIAITSVSSKMSVILPITFSIIYFAEKISFLKIVGVIAALIAIIFTVYKKSKSNSKIELHNIYLPLLLIVGMGTTDILIKISQYFYITEDLSSIFTAILFLISGITGLFFSIFKKGVWKNIKSIKVVLIGIILGLVNFGSIYFLINALNSNAFDSSIIFGINNIGIVALSVFLGLVLFKEKLSLINWIGIILSLIAIFVLSNS